MKKIFLFALMAGLLMACDDQLPPISGDSHITGLAKPVVLVPGVNNIPLGDFYTDPSVIDSVSICGLAKDQYSLEGSFVSLDASNAEALLRMHVWIDGSAETIPVFRSDKQVVEFVFDPQGEEYASVSVRGEFNGWTPGRPEFNYADGVWQGYLQLSPGQYQYLYVLDGEDALDPTNPEKVDNNMGKFNSLLSVGADIPDRLPKIFTEEYEDDDIEIGFSGEVDGLLVLWQNRQLPCAYVEQEDDEEYEIDIPAVAADVQRSFIRIWAWNEAGISNDLLIPLEYGKVLDDAVKITRYDQHSMILYNAFVDRFYDADPSNNRPLNDPEVRPAADYHGGDIKGVTEKIKDGYFEKLGVNTIWISPVVKNPEEAYGFWPDPPSKFSGYHGYWPISFTLIDDRYGTEDDLHELVRTAHENDMNVLLDFVANHVHINHPVYQEHPDWATELYLPDGSLNTERWDEYRLTTWFDVHLPTLDLERPEVYEMLTDSAVYWIDKYDLDGFRHDATKHIPEVFWRTLTRKLKKQIVEAKGLQQYQIGETYGGPELISSYVGSGMLDAQFDFNVYDDALAVLIRPGESFDRLDASIHESFRYYGVHNLMGYITGNQDRGRFTSYAGGALRFDEDAKLAGWTRDVTVGDPSAYMTTAMLFAFNMTIPGLPVIYYGDEIGMPGGNDPDSRRMMRFDNLLPEEEKLKEKVIKLTELRNSELPLVYGDFESLLVSRETYAYCRTYFCQIVVVAMNKSAEEKTLQFMLPERFEDVQFHSNFGTDPVSGEEGISITLGPKEFDVFTTKN